MATFRPLMLAALAALAACDDSPTPFDWSRGGIEIIVGFEARSAPGTYVTPDADAARRALRAAGEHRFEVQSTPWTPRGGQQLPALRIRVPLREWPTADARQAALAALRTRLGDDLLRADWSGQRLFVRSRRAVTEDEVATPLTAAGIEIVDHAIDTDDGTGEHLVRIKAAGPERLVERALESGLPDLDATALLVEMVGPQRRR